MCRNGSTFTTMLGKVESKAFHLLHKLFHSVTQYSIQYCRIQYPLCVSSMLPSKVHGYLKDISDNFIQEMET